MSICENISKIKSVIPKDVTLIAVSKTHPPETIKEAYNCGQRIFGENKVQELCDKAVKLPPDIQWHLIGHLQSNKVKYIAPFVSLIHSVDSLKLLQEIDKQAKKCNRIIPVLLQIHIAEEETKFGLSPAEAEDILISHASHQLQNIKISGLMGMATNTEDEIKIRSEFKSLKKLFDYFKIQFPDSGNIKLEILSMGMSSDFEIAVEEGSNMLRIGSTIFGNRHYA